MDFYDWGRGQHTQKNLTKTLKPMKQLPETVSIDEAVAFMINLSFVPEKYSIDDLLEGFRGDAENNFMKVNDKPQKDFYNKLGEIQIIRMDLAECVREALEMEMDLIRDGHSSKLKIESSAFISDKIVTPSLIEWADDVGFGITGWEFNPRWRKAGDRRFSTPYLEIIDEVINEFYEEGGKHYDKNRRPTNDEIHLFIEQKNLNISKKLIESICTILKQELTQTTKITDPK